MDEQMNDEVIVVDNRMPPALFLYTGVELRVIHSKRLSHLSRLMYIQLAAVNDFNKDVKILEHLALFNSIRKEDVVRTLITLEGIGLVHLTKEGNEIISVKAIREFPEDVVRFLKGGKK